MADNLPNDNSPAYPAAVASLATRQSNYVADVTAATCVAGRQGLRKKHTSQVEVSLLLLEEQRRTNRALEGMLDVFRSVVSLRIAVVMVSPH